MAASKVHLLCRAAACGTPTYTLVRLRSSALHFAHLKPFTCHPDLMSIGGVRSVNFSVVASYSTSIVRSSDYAWLSHGSSHE